MRLAQELSHGERISSSLLVPAMAVNSDGEVFPLWFECSQDKPRIPVFLPRAALMLLV